VSVYDIFDGDLKQRIEKAQEKAQRIISGKTDDREEIMLSIRLVLAEHYNMPLFHKYFEDRTLEDLVLEIEIVTRNKVPGAERGSQLLSDNKEQAEGMFDDWIEEDMSEPPMSDDEWQETAKKFMETGEFTEESSEE